MCRSWHWLNYDWNRNVHFETRNPFLEHITAQQHKNNYIKYKTTINNTQMIQNKQTKHTYWSFRIWYCFQLIKFLFFITLLVVTKVTIWDKLTKMCKWTEDVSSLYCAYCIQLSWFALKHHRSYNGMQLTQYNNVVKIKR